jgi:hypothetical protein
LRVDDEEYRADRRNRVRAAIEDHYARCLKEGDLTAAGADLDRLAKIDGCYQDKIEVTGAGGAPLAVSVSSALDELARAVAHVKQMRERTPEVLDAEIAKVLPAASASDPSSSAS